MGSNQQTYDVVIMGAGVAGCATAIALKNHNPDLSIAILERNDQIDPASKHYIGETLPPQASRQLQNLGIWIPFLSRGFVTSYGTSATWGSGDLYHNEYIYSPYGYGWHLDRKIFNELMIREAKKRDVQVFYKSIVTNAQKNNDQWVIEYTCGEKDKVLSSKFMVDATGKKASFSVYQNSKKIKEDQMIAVYRYYNKSDSTGNKIGNGTTIETDPNGWWYSATLPNDILVVAYMTDADIANQMQIRKKETFESILRNTRYTNHRVEGMEDLLQPRTVAAHTQHLSAVTGDSWLAVGDAASSYDPITSMGIFKSLLMSQFAAYAIVDDLKQNSNGLTKYQQIVFQDYKAYRHKRAEYYNLEKRYAESPFWKRRQKLIIN